MAHPYYTQPDPRTVHLGGPGGRVANQWSQPNGWSPSGPVPPGNPYPSGGGCVPPGNWQQPAPPPPNRKLLWGAAIGVVALVLVGAIAFVLITGGSGDDAPSADGSTTVAAETSTAPAPAKPTVPSAKIANMLLTGPQAAEVMSAPPGLVEDDGEPYDRLYRSTIADQECIGSVLVGQRATYDGSGYVSAAQRSMSAKPTADSNDYVWRFNQAATTFSDAAAAEAFVTKSQAAWQRCDNRSINSRFTDQQDSYDVYWTVGTSSLKDGTLSVANIQEGGGGWTCMHALTSRNNVVLDLQACSEGADDTAVAKAVDAFRAKVDAA